MAKQIPEFLVVFAFHAPIKLRSRNKVARKFTGCGSSFGRFQESLELTYPSRVPHLTQGLGLDLADSLPGDPKLPADLLKRAAITVHQPETLL